MREAPHLRELRGGDRDYDALAAAFEPLLPPLPLVPLLEPALLLDESLLALALEPLSPPELLELLLLDESEDFDSGFDDE